MCRDSFDRQVFRSFCTSVCSTPGSGRLQPIYIRTSGSDLPAGCRSEGSAHPRARLRAAEHVCSWLKPPPDRGYASQWRRSSRQHHRPESWGGRSRPDPAPSSSAALKALATCGSRIISEIWIRFTVVRNSDGLVRGVIITRGLGHRVHPCLGLEPGRKFAASPRLDFVITLIHVKVN
jgi:hypothetical protein